MERDAAQAQDRLLFWQLLEPSRSCCTVRVCEQISKGNFQLAAAANNEVDYAIEVGQSGWNHPNRQVTQGN